MIHRHFLLLFCCFSSSLAQDSRNLDRFNYRETNGTDYGPRDWNRVRCANPGQCEGWPDSWNTARGWDLSANGNSCRWCPIDGNPRCSQHHQSPINLERNRAIAGNPAENECIDVHWMKYEDSSCTWEQLQIRQAFTIERHALKMIQPLEDAGTEGVRLDCPDGGDGRGRRFGRIDFSKGFSQWWFLSHIDFKVPSEHTQEGKRYSAEVQMYHFYSVTGEQAGVDNEMASVTVFLEAYPDAPPYPFLDKMICQWRAAEERVRKRCGYASVPNRYPGCFPYRRRGTGRRLRTKKSRKPLSALDVIIQNYEKPGNETLIQMEEFDYRPDDPIDWEAFIEAQYETNTTQENRRLINYDHVGPWFNYFPMLGVRTEYYYRYSGTQTVPPCYGPFTAGSRGNTNHWRIMKDPIRVHPRQIKEMERLLARRIAPDDDPLNPCQPDTAGRPTPDGDPDRVEVNRPLQRFDNPHFKVFCECQDWRSKWREDRAWCAINNQNARLYNQPYNFRTNGF